MTVYYFKPHRPAGKADIYCVVLEGNGKGYVTQFHLSDSFAATFRHTEKYLKKNYIDNYNTYQLINAKTAKEKIINAGLERWLPSIQTAMHFNLSMF